VGCTEARKEARLPKAKQLTAPTSPPPSPSPQAEGAVGRGERAVQGRALEKKKQQQQQQQQQQQKQKHVKGGG